MDESLKLPEPPKATWQTDWHDIPQSMRQGLCAQQPNRQQSQHIQSTGLSGDPLLMWQGAQTPQGQFAPLSRSWYSAEQLSAYGSACARAAEDRERRVCAKLIAAISERMGISADDPRFQQLGLTKEQVGQYLYAVGE